MASMQVVEGDVDSYLKSLGLQAKKGDDSAFMDMIKEFPCIYNRASTDFKDRNLKANAWKIISEMLDLATEAGISKCKQRYESIRTTFSRYVRKASGKSGSGREDIQLEPKYEHLRWLVTFIKTRPTSGNLQVQQIDEEEAISDGQDGGESEILEENDSLRSEETSQSSEHQDSTELSDITTKKPASQKKLRKHLPKKRSWSPVQSVSDPNLELCKVMHNFQKSLQPPQRSASDTNLTPDTHYCLSLAERMSSLDNKTKAYVRHSIEKLFFEIESGIHPMIPAPQMAQYHATPFYNHVGVSDSGQYQNISHQYID